jgi:hypothetical protein
MSWDIFVQDIPAGAQSVADIPDNFSPQPIGSASQVLEAIRSVAPFADFSDPAWVRIDAPGVSLEVSVRPEESLRSFAFHIHGGEASAGVVADILQRLDLRAFDSASDSGIFDSSQAAESLHRWQEYRIHVLKTSNA